VPFGFHCNLQHRTDTVKNQFAMSDLGQLLRDVTTAVSSNLNRVAEPKRATRNPGEVREMVLALLDNTPKAGHGIAQQMRRLFGDAGPSTGEVFAALEALVAAELAEQTIDSELKCYALTEAGQAAQSSIASDAGSEDSAEDPDDLGQQARNAEPTTTCANGDSDLKTKADLARASAQLIQAIGAAAYASPKIRIRAGQVIAKASKDLFKLLAADD
jgi:DNA-binding PadR family transcriptional regulator